MRSSNVLVRLAAATAGGTYLLVVLGGVVRATGSGLGCPDWPKCHGSWIPPLEKEALIEYTHRSVALVVGVLMVTVVVAAWQQRREDSRPLWIAVAALGLVVLQALLGRQVVLEELDPLLVTVHLATAMALLALLILLAVPSEWKADRDRAATPWLLAAAFGVYVVILLGAVVRGESAGLAFPDWPLMNGRLVPDRLDQVPRLVHFLHRLGALTMGLYLGYLVLRLRPLARTGKRLFGVAAALFAVYGLQALIGAASVWFDLHPVTRVGHVSMATLAWAFAFLLPVLGGLAAPRDSEASLSRPEATVLRSH